MLGMQKNIYYWQWQQKYHKVRYHCHYSGNYREPAHQIWHLRYKIAKEIPVIFHNDSTYDYHFIIEELAKKIESQFEC